MGGKLHLHAGSVGVNAGGSPGRGGVNRGRGDAPMIWGDESPGRTDQFGAEVLPQARLKDLESSNLLGIGSAAPEVDARGESAGLSEVGASAGKTAWRRRLSPKHRRAVGTFFTGRSRAQDQEK